MISNHEIFKEISIEQGINMDLAERVARSQYEHLVHVMESVDWRVKKPISVRLPYLGVFAATQGRYDKIRNLKK
jgi:hypothetical protein